MTYNVFGGTLNLAQLNSELNLRMIRFKTVLIARCNAEKHLT